MPDSPTFAASHQVKESLEVNVKGVLLGQSQINCMTKVHARFALQKSIRYQYVKRKAEQWLI